MTNQNLTKITKSEQTKRNITANYLELILHKKWDRITIKELCAKTEITRGTFYQYYNDIYDLTEQIETFLLADLEKCYTQGQRNTNTLPVKLFEEKFDYSPPPELSAWFQFVKKNNLAVKAFLNPVNGNTYFVEKMKVIILKHINNMMDHDGMPRDGLREHFLKIFLELHFLSARTWLESDDDAFLSSQEIINLLNTMRAGANYLTYKRQTAPDFDEIMNITIKE